MAGSHLCIPRNELLIPKQSSNVLSPSSYTHISVRDLNIFTDRSAYSAARKYVDRSWDYINRSQTHECGTWDWGLVILRKGIHKWDFPCSVSHRGGIELKIGLSVLIAPWICRRGCYITVDSATVAYLKTVLAVSTANVSFNVLVSKLVHD